MIELLRFLGANGFQDLHRLYGGVEFMRVFTERTSRPVRRKLHVGRLEKARWDEAMRHGWTVTNMKTEWKKVFTSSR